jgi:hypothetical protein
MLMWPGEWPGFKAAIFWDRRREFRPAFADYGKYAKCRKASWAIGMA